MCIKDGEEAVIPKCHMKMDEHEEKWDTTEECEGGMKPCDDGDGWKLNVEEDMCIKDGEEAVIPHCHMKTVELEECGVAGEGGK